MANVEDDSLKNSVNRLLGNPGGLSRRTLVIGGGSAAAFGSLFVLAGGASAAFATDSNGYVDPSHLTAVPASSGTVLLENSTATAWLQMVSACHSATGVTLVVTAPYGGYRSYAQQQAMIASGQYSGLAPAGQSTHGWGTALDVYQRTADSWLASNAGHYGFSRTVSNEVFHWQYSPTATPTTTYMALAADFNGDGYADISLRDSSSGIFYVRHGSTFSDQIQYNWAAGTGYQAFVGDFNGDGYADIGLRDINTGTIYIRHGPAFADQIQYNWAAGSNYQVFAADFNHDGYADLGLRDANNGAFYIRHGPSFSDQIQYNWAAG